MPIRTQDYYEGAALYILAKTGMIKSIKWVSPFFVMNEKIWVLLKYATKNRSPWQFTFSAEEQDNLYQRARQAKTRIGLVCGKDGIVTLSYASYHSIANLKPLPVSIGCFRDHGEHYEIRGPDGIHSRKIAPSSWTKILTEETDESHRTGDSTVEHSDIQF
jgi:hypothetical protein